MHRHDVAMMRRNTFPYVRQDREEAMYVGEHDSFASRSDAIYAEPLPMDGSPHMSLGPEPSSLHINRGVHDFHPMSHSPGSSYRDFEHPEGSGVKMEDHSPVIISSQSGYVHSQQQSAQMPLAGYMSPHGIPIQHTDDAASKETQYLRRRCFNCHTTEPPSWRRSTLTPGKIVCNKCGLYERTHLRPRPLRFDELRAGNKSRKQSKTTSPKGGKIIPPGPLPIKKEPAEMEAIQRRMSVSSNSSVQSNGASSDWDDGISVYSGSAPASSYNSPQVPPFAMPRDSNSQSPPMGSRESGIRLPNAPLSDIASMQRKPASSPYFHANSLPAPGQGDMFVRRTAPADAQGNVPRRSIDIPEVTGWQTVPLTELGPSGKVVRKNSGPVRRAVAA
jgi:GATA-binding protein